MISDGEMVWTSCSNWKDLQLCSWLFFFHLKSFRSPELCFKINDFNIYIFFNFSNYLGWKNNQKQSCRSWWDLKFYSWNFSIWIHLVLQISISKASGVNTKRILLLLSHKWLWGVVVRGVWREVWGVELNLRNRICCISRENIIFLLFFEPDLQFLRNHLQCGFLKKIMSVNIYSGGF